MIFETYSYRKRIAARSEEPEVYSYDVAPEQLRHQISMALQEGIGIYDYHDDHVLNANQFWNLIDKACRKEIHAYLAYIRERSLDERFSKFLNNVENIDDFLDAVEIGCRVLSHLIGKHRDLRGAESEAGDSIKEINCRFEQHAIGFQFENQCIIKMDSKLTHAELIKPALSLLTAPLFSRANDEFLGAHKHYRFGDYKDCVTASNRSFESVLKAICEAEGWIYEKGDTAGRLVSLVKQKGLFTHEFDKTFDAYVAMLKNGLPTVRNDAGAHGEGLATPMVTAQIARYALNLTASNILFLAESYTALEK